MTPTVDRPDPDAPPPISLPAAACLPFLWPAIPESLVGARARDRIDRFARALPPVPRLAVELRLGAGAGDADLHQYIGREDAAAVQGHWVPGAPPALTAFIERWSRDGDGLGDAVDGLYLEWDAPGGEAAAAPALFLPLADRRPDDRGEARRAVLLAEAEALRAGGGPSLAATLERIERHLPAGAAVSFIGFMVGRGAAVRINLRGLRPRDLCPVLAGIGWPGDRARAGAHFARLVGVADRVVVALDAAPDIGPTIGFETVLDDDPAQDPRWAALFDQLITLGLCTPAQAAALRAVPARLLPETAGVCWPACWIPAAMRGPADALPWVERRLSHLKLTLRADGAAEAKAYASVQHHPARDDAPPRLRARAGAAEAPIARAAEGAVAFLLAQQAQDGLWRDFPSGMGPSDEWISGFVGAALVPRREARVADAIGAARDALLERQRAAGGWGYNAGAGPDADSTAWVMRLLPTTGGHAAAMARAEAFLATHALPGGGVSTYAPATPLAFAGRFDSEAGWRQEHMCVTANVAWRGGPELLARLRGAQQPDGRWAAYWWRDDAFCTALAVAALGRDTGAVAGAVRWARTAEDACPSAFDRAWLITILLRGDAGDRARARQMGAMLARTQLDDGSWPAGAALLFPNPDRIERSPDAAPAFDRRRVFTTASVLIALDALAVPEAG